MSQDQFQERIARIQQQRAAEKAAGGAARPARVAAMPQGTPEGFKVHRTAEKRAGAWSVRPALFGAGAALLSAVLLIHATDHHPDAARMLPTERIALLLEMLEDPEAPAEALPFALGAMAAAAMLVVQPVIGLLVGRWGAFGLVLYLGAAGLALTLGAAMVMPTETDLRPMQQAPTPEAAPEDAPAAVTPIAPKREGASH